MLWKCLFKLIDYYTCYELHYYGDLVKTTDFYVQHAIRTDAKLNNIKTHWNLIIIVFSSFLQRRPNISRDTHSYHWQSYNSQLLQTTIHRGRIFISVAELLEVDSKKLYWSLTNYCLIVNGAAVRRKQTVAGVYECIRVFAQNLYARLFDWIVNVINLKLSFTRAILWVRQWKEQKSLSVT